MQVHTRELAVKNEAKNKRKTAHKIKKKKRRIILNTKFKLKNMNEKLMQTEHNLTSITFASNHFKSVQHSEDKMKTTHQNQNQSIL